jgi:hypothetical protein
MGLFDLFRKTGAPAPEPEDAPVAQPTPPLGGRRFGFEPELMFDIGQTHTLGALFEVPREQRDADWVAAFYEAAWYGSVELADPQVFLGPDGFPYLRLNVPRKDQPFQSQCLANLAHDCLKQGDGAAFFASPDDGPEAAQFVLSLGLIDSLVRYDSPDGDPIDVAEAALPVDPEAFDVEDGHRSQTLVSRESQEVLIGTPSAEYLPPHAAAALARHLEEGWGVPDPRVQLLVNAKMRPHRSLVIGRRRSEFPVEVAIDDWVRALLWFLTPGRALMLMPEDWDLDQMTPLQDLA